MDSGLMSSLPDSIVFGIVGMGDMGCLYADMLSAHPSTRRVLACDLPSQQQRLTDKYRRNSKVDILENGALVARAADVMVYSVEAANLDKVVAAFGPASKVGSVVMGQSSVKQIEVDAFEKHLPKDVSVVLCHSLHGPAVQAGGQTVVMVDTRSRAQVFEQLCGLFGEAFGYKVARMTAEEHDTVTANTQVLTHLAFESMGTAWKTMGAFPWEHSSYVGGIDNVKVLACLRIYSSKAHVYCGLAMLNPRAKKQVQQYNRSVSELFTLMIKEDSAALRQRVMSAQASLFGNRKATLLPDAVMEEFSLSSGPAADKNNSHLSILAMVDSWSQLGIDPYQDMVCETPVFRLRLGIAEYLFTNNAMLEACISTACTEKSTRGDDFAFTAGVREWTTIITHGDSDGYMSQFESTKDFFKGRLDDGMKMSGKLIQKLAATQ